MTETRPDPELPEAASEEPAPGAAPQPAPESETDDSAREIAELKDQLLRAVAETENVRKRAARERTETARYAIGNFARDMAGIADDLARALDNLPDSTRTDEESAALLEGLELTRRNLDAAFERHGVERIDPAGEPFDHNFHEAMFEVEDGEAEPGTVVHVVQTGYRIHERLLRPARVGVAKRAAQGDDAGGAA